MKMQKLLCRSAIAAIVAGSASGALAAETRPDPIPADEASEERLVPLSLTGQSLTGSYGRIRPFWGRIRPFEVTSYWSGTNAFAVNDTELSQFWGRMRPFWGRIRPFWEGSADTTGLTPRWGRIRGFWGEGEFAALAGDNAALQTNLDFFFQDSRRFWDPIIRERTGNAKNFDTFMAEFNALLTERHGLSIPERERLKAEVVAPWTQDQRSRFIVEWYDQLMQYSGADQVDHWMRTVNWSPAITQQQGGGTGVKIGMLDSLVSGDPDLMKKITVLSTGKANQFSDGHGAAVASLLVSPHDGRGVMGIAPNAHIVSFNPYEADGTAVWNEVGRGLRALSTAGASVINLSLGVPGYTLHPEWNRVLSTMDWGSAKPAVMVFAAGNDGIVQSGNVAWDRLRNAPLIVVGSATADGTLSEFSNRPGNVCLTNNGKCFEMLHNRFIVAPGELLLLSDDKGGVIRHSGTSFAAPLVAGTIALLQDRWPWLKQYPVETADIILRSATPIAGTRPEDTGRGMLNVEASQSPLSFGSLSYYEYKSGSSTATAKTASQVLGGGLQEATWEANGMYFTAFETIGATQRDFAIPLSSKLVDQTVTMKGGQELFQHYLYSRFTDWMRTGTATSTTTTGKKGFGFTAPVGAAMGLNVTTTLAPANPALRFREGSSPYQVSIRFATPSDRFAVRMGQGDGVIALAGQPSFGLFSDYDVQTGGVNPILGFASGDGYGSMELALADNLRLSAGTTRRQTRTPREQSRMEALADIDDYRAAAMHVSLSYEASSAVSLNAAYTKLDEKGALLGVQSLDERDLGKGNTTDAATLGASVSLGSGVGLATSATLGRTRSGDASRQNLAVSQGGLIGTAFQVALSKDGLIGRNDRVRLSLSQPLFVEKGYLDFTQVKVIDRQTGEIGAVTERFEVSDTKRPWVGEFLYGAQFGASGELSAFGRAEQRSGNRGGERDFMIGARLSFGL